MRFRDAKRTAVDFSLFLSTFAPETINALQTLTPLLHGKSDPISTSDLESACPTLFHCQASQDILLGTILKVLFGAKYGVALKASQSSDFIIPFYHLRQHFVPSALHNS
jgi:hypothetical protein